ncbi:terminase large subunit [Halobacillus sp. KGW1]|uniref:terminase large subunit n=1 Tax=Halobacillus sp. KGW1 TaxID=1793726 RepID=UPI000785B1C7|nr:terminase TerL endonuclease subunit [Halobacillus sp. KGW1]
MTYLKNNPIIEYHEKLQSGEEVASKKVIKVYKHLVEDIIEKEDCEWEYDPEKAGHAIEFIERFCKHSKGKMGGKPFILELWQLALIAAMFGIVHKLDGTRKYQESVLIVARKNGKSTIAAAVALYLQIADGELGPEIYAVATKKDQAKIIWLEAKRMVKKSPVLRKRIKPLVSEMVSEFNDGTFKPLGRDSETIDGLNVHGATFDEVHAWKDMNMYDVVVDGTSSRDNPLIFITSTAGTVRESVFDRLYDECEMVINGYDDPEGYKNERLLPIIYELDARKEWTDEKTWKKANPGLGTIKKVESLKQKVNKAKANSMLVKNLVCKDFNIRETNGEAWLTFDQLNNMDKFNIEELKPRYGIGGVDLASTTDLTCATVIFMVPNDESIYVEQMYWLPADLIEKRTEEDRIPYDKWVEQGYMRLSEGNKVHYRDVTKWFVEMQQEKDLYIPWIGYDAWSATYLVEELQNHFGKDSAEAVIQGKKTLSAPMKSLGADLENKRIVYNNNPILKWCLSNVSYEEDKNGNIQPIKGNNSKRRIDGMASLLDAYVVYERHLEEYLAMI